MGMPGAQTKFRNGSKSNRAADDPSNKVKEAEIHAVSQSAITIWGLINGKKGRFSATTWQQTKATVVSLRIDSPFRNGKQRRLELRLCLSVGFPNGRTIRIADARRDDGKRFAVHADVRLTAFFRTRSGNSRVLAITLLRHQELRSTS
jgi:hypothetical protein